MTFLREALASGRRYARWSLLLAPVLLVTFATASAAAATAPSLGPNGSSFAVLAASTVTSTGDTRIAGELGVSPGTAITGDVLGFPPGEVSQGTIHLNDGVAIQAKTDVTAAYASLVAQSCDEDLTGQDLGGLTKPAGVYCYNSSAQLTGSLTLDGEGNPNAVFIFQIGSTLTTASASDVLLTNGASPCNVFFQVGSSATLGTTTEFKGNILALASITMTTDANITGRLLALTAAVTLDSNDVQRPSCASTAVTVRSFTATPSTGSVLLKWKTASEVGVLGYNVYGQLNGNRVKLNRTPIMAKSTTRAASYAFRYRGKKASTRFWLQAVNLDGSRSWSGAATIASQITG